MGEKEFADWWATLSSKLKAGTVIPHWSAQGQYQPDGFRISNVDTDRVWYSLGSSKPPATKTRQPLNEDLEPIGPAYQVPNNDIHYVMKQNFWNALNVWREYCQGNIARERMDGIISGSSTYVISIIHWMETNLE